MPALEQSGLTKIGSVIYLRSIAPLRSAAIVQQLQKSWPDLRVGNVREQADSVFLRVGTSEIAIHLRRAQVPAEVSAEILAREHHRREAEAVLARHQAHVAVVVSAVKGAEMSFASDLTKAIIGVLETTDALAVGWLNGPVFHETDDFVAIGREMFGAGVLPLLLWVGVHWEGGAKGLHTKGMVQFGAPEVMIAQQIAPSPDLAGYLFEVSNYILTSGKEIIDGETMDGPGCTFKVESVKGADPSKRMLILVPVRVN